jgi:PAS domain-containing protein
VSAGKAPPEIPALQPYRGKPAVRNDRGDRGNVGIKARHAPRSYPTRWFLTRFEPLRASDGTILQWVGVNLDIEGLMRAQEALRESERSSRSAFDGIAGLVAVLAPNGELETVNRQLLEYFGQPVEWIKNWGTNDAVPCS